MPPASCGWIFDAHTPSWLTYNNAHGRCARIGSAPATSECNQFHSSSFPFSIFMCFGWDWLPNCLCIYIYERIIQKHFVFKNTPVSQIVATLSRRVSCEVHVARYTSEVTSVARGVAHVGHSAWIPGRRIPPPWITEVDSENAFNSRFVAGCPSVRGFAPLPARIRCDSLKLLSLRAGCVAP